MKKKLDTSAIRSELSGNSAFFPNYKGGTPPASEQKEQDQPAAQAVTSAKKAASPPPPAQREERTGKNSSGTMIPRHHDTTTPRNHDTMVPVGEDALFEVVRKAVKQVGKEAATHRFTAAEKDRLKEIEFNFRREGIRTSENEISRIAINYLVEDYRAHGEESVLAKVLRRLNS